MACFRGLYAPNHPQFAENSLAARKDEVLPAAIDAPDIVYSEEDDKAIETYIRKVGQSDHSYLGPIVPALMSIFPSSRHILAFGMFFSFDSQSSSLVQFSTFVFRWEPVL